MSETPIVPTYAPQGASAYPPQGAPVYAPGYTPPYPPQRRVYTPFEAALSPLILLLSMLLVQTVRSGGGIGVSLFFIGMLLLARWYLYKQGHRLSSSQKGMFAVLLVLSCGFALYSFSLLTVCALLFLGGFCSLWLYSAFNGTPLFHRFWLSDLVYSITEPFLAFGSLFGSLRALKKRKSGTAIGIVIGLAVALPLTAVVAALLLSADIAFAEVFADLFSSFIKHFGDVLFDLLFGLLPALYLHAMLIEHREGAKADHRVREQQRQYRLAKMRIAPASSLYTACTPILCLYVLFLVVQSGYFFSAFSGLIPTGMTYSACARRGFFELCAVAAINLCVLLLMWRLCRYIQKPPRALRVYGVLLSLITLLLIAIAVSKMVLYMQFGLTILRVYTIWFMALLAVLFVLIALRMLLPRLPLIRVGGIAAFAMCFVLLLSPVNRLIAEYNTAAYQRGEIEMEIGYMEMLGDAAIPSVVTLCNDRDQAVAKRSNALVKAYRKAQQSAQEDGVIYVLTWTLERTLAETAVG